MGLCIVEKIRNSAYPSIEGKFENYFSHYISKIYEQLLSIDSKGLFSSQNDQEKCYYALIEGILKNISSVAISSLIDYYQEERAINPNLSYKDYNENLQKDRYFQEFHQIYPTVKDNCEVVICNYIQRTKEVFSLLQNYQVEIRNVASLKESESLSLSNLNIFEGDFHINTFVVILTLNEKRILIKKRPNLGDRLLRIFQKYFDKENIKLPIANTIFLDDDLCLQEYIKSDSAVLNSIELQNFYYKFGIMTAIFTILGSKDLHSENIISTKYGPYFIDLEAAITDTLNREKLDSLLTETYLFNSKEKRLVYGSLDLSAFSGGDITTRRHGVIHKGQDDINIGVYSYTEKHSNIPQDINGAKVNPEEYSADVLKGFDTGIRIFLKYKERLIQKLELIESYDYRVVLRNTAFYGKYLDDLNLPMYTKSKEKSEKYIHLLRKHSKRDKKIVDKEMACLKQQAIPYFLISEVTDNKIIKDNLIKRIEGLSLSDLNKEKYYLQLILGLDIPIEGRSHYLDNGNKVDNELQAFESFCSNDVGFKFGVIDHTVQNTLLHYCNDIYTFGASLLFLARYCKNSKLREKIITTVRNGGTSEGLSGLIGRQSSYLLYHYFNLESEKQNYTSSKDIVHEKDIVDFSTYGSAILVLNYLYKETSNKAYLDDIKLLGEIYLKTYTKRNLTGLFHGYAGDILVLSVLRQYIEHQTIDKDILDLIQLENSNFNKVSNNWNDTRHNISNTEDLCALSYGAVGILFSRHLLYRSSNLYKKLKDIVMTDLFKALNCILVRNRSDYVDDSLVNGYAGALVVLKIILQSGLLNNHYSKLIKVKTYIEEGEKLLENTQWRYEQFNNLLNPSFFSGRLGTAFTLWFISQNDFYIEKFLGV
nr:type 2 lanthipeptide synthetase LanM family protein [Streptococcus mutans]